MRGRERGGRAEAGFINGESPGRRQLLRGHAFSPLSVVLGGRLLSRSGTKRAAPASIVAPTRGYPQAAALYGKRRIERGQVRPPRPGNA